MGKSRFLAIPALFLLIACGGGGESGPASSTCDFYVDAAGGNDGNNGSATEPFQTITFALSQAASGDEVCVEAGNYNAPGETFPIAVPTGVTLRGNPGSSKPVISGGGDFGGANIAIITAHNSTISGFSITVPGYADTTVIHVGVFSDDGFPVISDNTISNVSLGHQGGGGIATFGTASPLIMANTIISNHDGIATFGTSAPVIRDNDLSDNEDHGVYADQNSDPDLGTSGDPGGNTILGSGLRGLGNFTDSSVIDAAGNTWEVNCSTNDGSYATTLVVVTVNPINDNDSCPGEPSNYYIKYIGAGIQF